MRLLCKTHEVIEVVVPFVPWHGWSQSRSNSRQHCSGRLKLGAIQRSTTRPLTTRLRLKLKPYRLTVTRLICRWLTLGMALRTGCQFFQRVINSTWDLKSISDIILIRSCEGMRHCYYPRNSQKSLRIPRIMFHLLFVSDLSCRYYVPIGTVM